MIDGNGDRAQLVLKFEGPAFWHENLGGDWMAGGTGERDALAFPDLLEAGSGPVWLLDVDGVVNARRHRWPCRIERQRVRAAGEEFSLSWAPMLLDRIRTLVGSRAVDLVWCSTWNHSAEALERLWGLPALARAWTAALTGTAAGEAKRAAATEVLLAGRPLIWTDDEYAEDVEEPDRLEIRPDARRGLGPADLDAIERFVADHRPP